MKRKAQSWSLDFSLGMVLFLLAVVLSIKFLANSAQTDVFRDVFEEAKFLSDQIRSEGYPANWTNDSFVRLGVLRNGSLDEAKLANFSQLDYTISKAHLNTRFHYYFFFVDRLNRTLNLSGTCGFGHPNITLLSAPSKAAYYYSNITDYFMHDTLQNVFGADIFMQNITGSGIADLLASIDEYDFVFLEDPEFDKFTNNLTDHFIAERFQNWTAKGNTLAMTEDINIEETLFFSMNVSSTISDGSGAATIRTPAYFNLTQDPIVFFEDTASIYPVDPDNYLLIANYSGEKPAIATWTYGYGRLFYLSDIDIDDFNLYAGERDLVPWVRHAIGPFVHAHCGEVNVSAIDQANMVKVIRLLPHDGQILTMPLYVWTAQQ